MFEPKYPVKHFEMAGFDLLRQDRVFEKTNKKKGGGLCIYVNTLWCNNFTIRSSVCCKDIEPMCVSFRPYYLPREFPQVHVFLVYIPPDANSDNAIHVIQENVQEIECQSPDSPKIVLGDFNHCRLEDAMPHYITSLMIAQLGELTS